MFNRAAEAITGHHAALVRGQGAIAGAAAAGADCAAPCPTWSPPDAAAASIYPFTLRDGQQMDMGMTSGR